MNHYPRHIGDYAKDTMGFSALDHGIYNLLLDAYYAAEQALDAEEVHSIAKASTPAERKAVDKVLKKFRLCDGLYFHKRVEEELAAFRKRSAEATEKANLRWKKDRERKDAGGNATASQQHQSQHEPGHSSGNAGAMLASSHKPVINQQPGKAQQSGIGDIPADPHRVAALTAIFESDGHVELDAKARMHLRQFASEGVTDQQLADAVAIARERSPLPKVLYAGLVASIMPDVRSGTARRTHTGMSREDVAAESLRRIATIEAREAAKGGQHGPN